MKNIIFVKLLLLSSFVYGQNLLRNGGFESFTACPNDQNNGGAPVGTPIPFLNDWFTPNLASADYCNRCNFDSQYPPDFDPPATDLNGGTGYLGIINSGSGTSEQAAQCLTSTILSGSTCTFIVHVNTAVQRFVYPDFSPYPSPEPLEVGIWGATTCTGIEYSSSNCPTNGGKTLLGSTKVFNIPNGSFNWLSDTISFVAPFDIDAISIGGICRTGGGSTLPTNYYYIDEVSLTAVSPCPSAPTGSGGNASVCGGGSFTFPARSCGSGTLRWYENSSGTGSFYTGASVTPSSTTTYYPFCYTTCLSPAGNPATATVTCPASGSGSTWTWTGCQSTNWFDPCNWDRGSIPNTTSNVIIPNTVNKPTINGGIANCYDITINSTAGAEVTITSTGSLNITKP